MWILYLVDPVYIENCFSRDYWMREPVVTKIETVMSKFRWGNCLSHKNNDQLWFCQDLYIDIRNIETRFKFNKPTSDLQTHFEI